MPVVFFVASGAARADHCSVRASFDKTDLAADECCKHCAVLSGFFWWGVPLRAAGMCCALCPRAGRWPWLRITRNHFVLLLVTLDASFELLLQMRRKTFELRRDFIPHW